MHSRLYLLTTVLIWCFFATIADTDVPSEICSNKRSPEVAAGIEDETCLLQKGTRVAERSKRAKDPEDEEEKDLKDEHSANSADDPAHAKKSVKGDDDDFSSLMGFNTNFYFDIEDNQTMTEHFYNEIKFEVGATKSVPPEKNKLILLMLQITIVPAFFGIDRCYMEQPFMGLLKALTFSGLGVWGLLDTIVVMFNAVSRMRSIHTIGLVANFDKDSTVLGFYLGTAWLTIWAFCCCCSIWCGTSMKYRQKGSMPPEIIDPDDK